MKFCKLCNVQYNDKFKFCPQCGQLLVNEVIRKCNNCGLALEEKMIYCPECGTRVDDSVVNEEVNYGVGKTVDQSIDVENNYEKAVVNEKIALLSKKQWYFICFMMVVSWISRKGNAVSVARKGYYGIGSFDIMIAALVDTFSCFYLLAVYNLIREKYRCGEKKKMWIYIMGSIIGFCLWAVLRIEILRMLKFE